MYVAQLIHQDICSVLKLVRYGVPIAWFPEPETVEKIDQFIFCNTTLWASRKVDTEGFEQV